jgi:phosphonate degradation associated HDIG domain protein
MPHASLTNSDRLAVLRDLLLTKGVRQYGLDNVSQLEHALQAAWLAERAGEDDAMVTAGLLHDVGHMVHDLGDELGENLAAHGIDDVHEEAGRRFLAAWFDDDVTAPVRLHVDAKRFLCGSEPEYFAKLSPDSVLSLKLQGGPMDADEQALFAALPFSADAVRLRRYDDAAKVPALATPHVDHFLRYVERSLTV